MTDHVYKYVEVVGTSHKSNDAAIAAALERVQSTVRNVRWFEVTGQRGFVETDGSVQFQVTLKVGFSLED
ncbi:MAG: dodecin [Novosphingobium sp.]